MFSLTKNQTDSPVNQFTLKEFQAPFQTLH
jgi:hypothetical protein